MTPPARDFEAKVKTCYICGNQLPMYMRICDKCGSILRPSKGDGVPMPPELIVPCVRCGKPIPKEDKILEEWLCDECWAALHPTEVRHRRSSMFREYLTACIGMVGLVGICISIWGFLAFENTTGFALLLVFSALTFLTAGLALVGMVVSYRRKIRPKKPPPEEE